MVHNLDTKNTTTSSPKHFQEFIFVGNCSSKSVTYVTEQLHLPPNSKTVSQAAIEENLLITQMHTVNNITRQLKNLDLKPGAMVKLVSKTNNGSVVVSLGDKLIGMGAEVAHKIVATSAT